MLACQAAKPHAHYPAPYGTVHRNPSCLPKRGLQASESHVQNGCDQWRRALQEHFGSKNILTIGGGLKEERLYNHLQIPVLGKNELVPQISWHLHSGHEFESPSRFPDWWIGPPICNQDKRFQECIALQLWLVQPELPCLTTADKEVNPKCGRSEWLKASSWLWDQKHQQPRCIRVQWRPVLLNLLQTSLMSYTGHACWTPAACATRGSRSTEMTGFVPIKTLPIAHPPKPENNSTDRPVLSSSFSGGRMTTTAPLLVWAVNKLGWFSWEFQTQIVCPLVR